jgi:hypothetical protein
MIIYLCNQEGKPNGKPRKKSFKNLKKPLDKPNGMCYNINVIKERSTTPKEREMNYG